MKRLAGRAVSGNFGQHLRAPRAFACSYSSSTNIHAPSPSTNPSRSAENGRDARSGSSFHDAVMILISVKPFMMPGAIGASTPPASIMGMIAI